MKTIILCGGSGTRLWPLSRKSHPKQFAQILNNQSLYEKTIERNKNKSEKFITIVNEKQIPLCQEQSLKNQTQFIIEPIGRNTAPAIALGCFSVEPDDIILVVASDHLINNQDLYEKCLDQACEFASQDKLVTFGINPRYPETGYGYIEANGSDVKSFKEKPNLEKAKKYIEDGNYYWNSGMFCFKAKVFLEELKKYSPDIYNAAKTTYDQKITTDDMIRFDVNLMKDIPSNSIDYAVMEKSENVKVVASNFEWSDMGSFDSLFEELEKDKDGNTKHESSIHINSQNNLIIGGKRVIATFDTSDLIIIDTEDALLIGKRGESQKVKDIVSKLKDKDSSLLD